MAQLLAIGYALISQAVAQGTLQLQLSQSLPQGASSIVSPSFAGFGIEPSNLFSYTGYSSANELTFNLIDNLVNYTGAPPHIRIGGNTQDYMVFDPNMSQWTWINNPNSVGQGALACDHMLIGPRFFQAANRFPQGTPTTWGLNLAYQQPDYIEQLVTMAEQVLNHTSNLNIVGFEIGNEPDLYAQNGFRTGPWGGDVYVKQWLDRASQLWDRVLRPNGIPSNFFEPGTTASTIGTSFQISDMVTLGIDVQANNSAHSYISTWNQHDYYYYIGVSTYPLTLERFMTLSTTNDQFAAWEKQIDQAHNTAYPYALREMGVVGPIGYEGITNTFAAALWTLNFFLYGARLNMSSVQLHMTDNSNASAWQPIEMYGRQPFVRPGYYGYAAFDQIIGRTCQAQVVENTLSSPPTGYDNKLKSYNVYQDGSLATVVVINSMMSNVSSGTKNSIEVDLSFPTSMSGKVLHLAYLTGDGADATSGTTWNGISYEKSGNGKPTIVDSSDQTVTISSNGKATVTVRDSQAIAANVGSRVGSGTANSAACKAIASKSPGFGSTTSSSSGSASSSNAATSMRQGGASRTGTSATATATNGVRKISAFIFSTLGASLTVGAFVILA